MSQLIPFCLTTSIIKEILIGPLKILTGSCTELNVDFCSGSNLKYWFRLLLQHIIQTLAGVHSGTPTLWSSLVQVHLLSQSGIELFI